MQRKIYYISFVFLLLIIYHANWQLIDDHSIVDSLTQDKYLTTHISEEMFKIGRFFPLCMQEFNVIFAINKTVTPLIMYIFVGLQFVIYFHIMYKNIYNTLEDINYYKILFLLILLYISPGFVTAFLRLFVPERSVLFFLAIFFYYFISYQENQNICHMLLGLISANFALYYKEPVFIMLGVFAFLHLFIGWKKINYKQKSFDAYLIASSFVFLAAYYFVVYSNITGIRYGVSDMPKVSSAFLRSIFNISLNDPMIILVLIIILYRFVDFYKKRTLDPLYDSMLLASIAYISSFYILGMNIAPHYLLPAYVPGIISLSYFFFTKNYKTRKSIRVALILVIFILFTNTLPATLHTISYYKNTTKNFQETLDFLEEYAKKQGFRIRIFLDGVNRGGGIEVYNSMIKYLNSRGLLDKNFDLLSDEESNSSILFTPQPDSPYTVFQSAATYQPVFGDILLISPYSVKGASLEYLNNISLDYEMIFRTNTFFSIPLYTIKEAIRSILTKLDSHLMAHISGRTMDYYVFKKTR